MSSEEQKQGRTVRESIQETSQVKETVTDATGNVISEKMVDVADGGAGKASGEAPPTAAAATPAAEPTDADLEVEAAKEGLIPAEAEDEDEEIDEDEEETDSDEES